MRARSLVCVAATLAVALAASPAWSQVLVTLDGGPPTLLPGIPVPPAITPPPCAPIPPPCPVPPLPPFPPGFVPPSIGGEAVDEATATVYSTDGVLALAATAYPSCAPGAVFPLCWPPGACGPVGGAPTPACPGGPPIVAMCDSAVPGHIWVLNAMGLASLVPVPPVGPPIAQILAPVPILPGPVSGPTGITFDPSTSLLWFTGAFVPAAIAAAPPALPGVFVCVPAPPGPMVPIPACLPPPYVGITIDTAVAPAAIPSLWVLGGGMVASLAAGACPCPVVPPSSTDLDFADVPFTYGMGCGCGPPTIGTTGGLPVLGNGGFTVTAAGVGPGIPLAALFLSIGPGPFFIPCGCTLNLFPGFLLPLGVVPVLPLGPPVCPGTASLPLPIAAGPPGFVGITLYLTWAFFPIPAGLPCGFSLSDGLEMTIGFP